MEELEKIMSKFKLKDNEIESVNKTLTDERLKNKEISNELNILKATHQEMVKKFNIAKQAFKEVK